MQNELTNDKHMQEIADDLSSLSKQITEAKQSVERDKGGLQQLAEQIKQRFGIPLEEIDTTLTTKKTKLNETKTTIISVYNKLKDSYQW